MYFLNHRQKQNSNPERFLTPLLLPLVMFPVRVNSSNKRNKTQYLQFPFDLKFHSQDPETHTHTHTHTDTHTHTHTDTQTHLFSLSHIIRHNGVK